MEYEMNYNQPLEEKKYGEPISSAYGSGGSLRDPMYKNIQCEGTYHPQTGRGKRRHALKERGISISKKKKFFEL